MAALTAHDIRYQGLDEALAVLEAAHGPVGGAPFDAWVGFSQGAVLAHHIIQAGMASKASMAMFTSGSAPVEGGPEPSSPRDFSARCAAILPRSAVLVCGFPSRALTPWRREEPIPLRSMHLTSPKDTTVSEELALQLLERFDPATRSHMRHTHGHAMIQRAADVEFVLDWVAAAVGASEGGRPAEEDV